MKDDPRCLSSNQADGGVSCQEKQGEKQVRVGGASVCPYVLVLLDLSWPLLPGLLSSSRSLSPHLLQTQMPDLSPGIA